MNLVFALIRSSECLAIIGPPNLRFGQNPIATKRGEHQVRPNTTGEYKIRPYMMSEIASYFWRLIPANPILLRVVQTKSKRRFDMFVRCGYLGLLVAIVIFAIAGNSSGNLDDLAKTSAQLFQTLSYCQLALVCFLAPIFTAGAITQEKDSQTYDILLATPLNNGQILFGSMLSRLFFIVALLVSGIPIFSITQIFGGVAIRCPSSPLSALPRQRHSSPAHWRWRSLSSRSAPAAPFSASTCASWFT